MKPIHKLLINMHPLQRMLLSLAFCAAIFFCLPKHQLSTLMIIILTWIAFAFSYTLMNVIILFKRSVEQIKKTAMADDGSAAFVLLMILFASFASVVMVLLLIISKEQQDYDKILFAVTAISGMLISWVMIHTVFTFHYAHMYYNDGKKASRGLSFPGEEDPDYLDFAYFAFVIGCTFQVSDVEITSKSIRRLVLLHGLLSFGLNTFVVALIVNLVAGISD
jgi:uncharacterized membrane protein